MKRLYFFIRRVPPYKPSILTQRTALILPERTLLTKRRGMGE